MMMNRCNTKPYCGLLHLRNFSLFLLSLFAVLTCFNVCLNTAAAAAAANEGKAVVDPSEPLINVPFRITASFLKQGQNLYLSRDSTCDTSQVTGSICTLPASRTCDFTISDASVGINAQYESEVPLLYLCSSAFSSSVPIQTVQLSVIDVMPRFVMTGSAFRVTVNNATPLETVIGFFYDDDCKNSVSGMPPVVLGADRQLSLTVSTGDVIRLCARVPLTVPGPNGDSLSSYLPAATLLVVRPFTVNKTQVLRYTKEEFRLSPFSQIPVASFSQSSHCIPLGQDPVSGYMLQQVVLPIQVPKGNYYLCTGLAYYKEKRLYVPSDNQVVVKAYGLQPHTMYTSLSTTITLTLDANTPSSGVMSTALFSSPGCENDNVIPWSSTTKTWTVSSSGIYYACVKGDTSSAPAAMAANITVMDPPMASLSRTPAIRGLPLTVTLSGRVLSNPGIITVGLSLTSTCSKLVASGVTTATGNVATFRVPADALAKMTLCISTPLASTSNGNDNDDMDQGYTYARSTITTQEYNISYGPLFAGIPGTITLDPTVRFDAGTTGIFALGSCDNATSKSFSMDGVSLNNVVFESAGQYLLCVNVAASSSSSSSKESSYTPIGNVFVYGPLNLSPYSLVVGVLTNVQVSLIPPTAPVRIMTSDDCNGVPLVEGTANNAGEVTLKVSYDKEVNLTVCVGYRGSNAQGGWNVRSVGKLPVTQVTLLPKAIITSQVNRVNFIVPDKISLTGLQAFVVSAEGGSCANPPLSSPESKMSVIIPTDGRAYILFTPSTSTTTWMVCLSTTSTVFNSVGTITAVSPLDVISGSSDNALDLPARIKLGGSSLKVLKPTRFFITDIPKSCARAESKAPPLYAEGVMDASTGEVSAFLMKNEGNFTLCVGWQDGENQFFVYGASIQVEKFKTLSRYAIRESKNNLTAFPLQEGATLFLVACSPASVCNSPITATVCKQASKRYFTSPLVPLTGAAVGQYVLCQEDAKDGSIVAAESLIDVVNPFMVTFAENEVRQYKPVSITVSGGDMNTRSESIIISTMPPGVNCGASHPDREEFTFTPSKPTGNITITKIEPYMEGVQLCLGVSTYDVLSVAVFNLLSYMTPATIITDRKVSVRSGMWETGVVVKLTATNDCTGNVMNSSPVLIHNYVSELFVEGCASTNTDLTKVYYCESKDGMNAYELRGMMRLIRLKNCTPDKPSVITPITVPPSQTINDYGIDTTQLMNPVLSRTSDCLQLVTLNENAGYTPSYDDTTRFFVCVNAKGDPAYLFTTDTPTLSVINHLALPTSIPSRLSASVGVAMMTVLQLNYNTGTSNTYLSDSAKCDSTIAKTPDLGREPPRAQLILTGVSGIKYVCVVRRTSTSTSETKPVSRLLVVNPPQATKLDPALVRGAPFHATLQVITMDGQPPTYSLVPGADSGYAVAPFYTSSFRGIYLSGDACRSVLSGTEVNYVLGSGRVAIPTNSIDSSVTSFSLCAGTPAGNLTVETGISLSTNIIFPSQFVLGADLEVYIPLSPTTVFHLRRNNDCSGPEIVPSFSTNEEGRGNLSFKLPSGAGLPPSGEWTLCEEQAPSQVVSDLTRMHYKVEKALVDSLRPLTTIQAFDPVYFNVRGTNIIVGVPSVAMLLDRLTADNLLPGFSTDRSCVNRGETYGSWHLLNGATPTDSTRISIDAKEPVNPIYMCATTPINNTVVSLPTNGGFNFLVSTVSLPSIVPRCEPLPLDSCALPGSPPPTASLIVIKGDCCNVADRGNVVGRATQTADGHCALSMDPRRLNAFPPSTNFAVCAVDTADMSYCATLGQVRADEKKCSDEASSTQSLATGTRIAIGILSAVLALLIIAAIVWLVLRCRRTKKDNEKHAIGPAAMNPLMVEGPLMLNLRGTSEDYRTITISPSTDRATHSLSPPGIDMRLWEEGEHDIRDQLALQEARDRYHMRLVFTEGLERLRVAEKERDLLFELSGDDEGEDERNGNCFSYNNNKDDYNSNSDYSSRVAPIAVGRVASAPPAEELNHTYLPHPPVEIPINGTSGAAVRAVAGVVVEEGPLSPSPVPHNPHDASSPGSSFGTISYTTTQRFHDECRFTLENEAVRRQRILNWEEEELHTIIDNEFNDYVRLQQSLAPPPPPPVSEVVVLPFTAAFTEVAVANDDHPEEQEEDDEDDIYDAPDIPAPLVKYNNLTTESGTTAVAINDDVTEEEVYNTPSGCTGEGEEMASGDTIFSGSIPSLSKPKGGRADFTSGEGTNEEEQEQEELKPTTPHGHKRRLGQEKTPEEGGGEEEEEEEQQQQQESHEQRKTKLKRQRKEKRVYTDPLSPPSTPPDIDDSTLSTEATMNKTSVLNESS
ncbi:uncharacterized protein TM35_000271860 [Trypanosoma theileri]|uniref:Membrane-associated protein n=1 Tax=Trypanosoma theileri TaxID=67003 RepID=A0A1X0NPG0_9TRYP|nr:uncharacterized protein TM35_000271860 [Trypanosoma theileri]ORC86596.1 hypothetical protein TM35_000271860 [Trypanosoma theileri]